MAEDSGGLRRIADCRDEDAWEPQVDEANALLCSAAPELLEALEALHREAGEYADVELVGDQGLITALKQARAAIAKAKAKQDANE